MPEGLVRWLRDRLTPRGGARTAGEPAPPDRAEMERPIFVFAQPRSGSTLVQRVLNSLDGVIIYGEHLGLLKGVAGSYVEFMNRRDQAFCSENPVAAEVHAQDLSRLKDPADFSPNANCLSYAQVRAGFGRFVTDLVHPIREPRFQRWGFKEIRYGSDDVVFEMLLDLFPAATFIFVVRHPFGQIASLRGTGWTTKPLQASAEAWRDQTAAFLRRHRDHAARAHLLRYEDLVRRDNGAPRRLIEALGYAYGERQEQILFGMGKVGGTQRKPEFAAEDLELIRRVCLVPETAGAYDS